MGLGNFGRLPDVAERQCADVRHEFRHRDRSVTPRMNERTISEQKEKKRTVCSAVKNKKIAYWLEKAVQRRSATGSSQVTTHF
jgi:hypothetical protein